MTDDLFERIESLTTSILKKGGTPLEQSAIGLLADCRYDIDTLSRQLAEKDAEIERLREARRERVRGCICPPTSEKTCGNILCPRQSVSFSARAALEEKE